MKKRTATRHLSVNAKINLTLLLVFAVVLIALVSYSMWRERDMVTNVVEQQTKAAALSYFDSVNTMMLTGTMSQRSILRKKFMDQPGIIDARIIRSDHVSKQFGPGLPDEKPTDQLDREALKGKGTIQVVDTPKGRVLTVIHPMRASKDYRGTNCLMCHQVKDGTVMGAVRISYSLNALDKQVDHNAMVSAGIQIALFAAALGLMIILLRRVVTNPLNRLRATVEAIEQDSDLTRTIDIHKQDEIGAVASALNSMLGRFHSSIQEVYGSTHKLATVAERLAAVSEETVRAIFEQRNQTDQVATAMNEMSATVQEVASHAASTAETSGQANDDARSGAYVSTEALGAIDALTREMERAANVVAKLEEDSGNIGMVLDVIKGIAEQTNLLALNAAIEAARAGEQGRGFAVVADEVRTLASRTQQSTEEIQNMIERLQQGARDAVGAMNGAHTRAEAGSEQVEAAAESLGSIAGEIASINDMNTQIATAAEEQSAVAEEINRNVVTISEMADKTSEGARQTSAVGEELVELAGRLEKLVDRFKL